MKKKNYTEKYFERQFKAQNYAAITVLGMITLPIAAIFFIPGILTWLIVFGVIIWAMIKTNREEKKNG